MDEVNKKHFFAAREKYLALFRSHCCLHPDAKGGVCNGKSRAHTIQRSGVLESIAVDGHVCQLVTSFDTGAGPGIFECRRVGTKEASTFPGLCNRHDSELFKPIETAQIIYSKEQVFLLSYRALLREYFAKLQATRFYEFIEMYRKKHYEIRSKRSDNYIEGATVGTDHGFAALKYHKAIYDSALSTRNFEDIRFVALEYDRASPILCSCSFSPEYDYDGNLLQNLGDLSFVQNFISFTIWRVNLHGVALLAWHKSSEKSCLPFVCSLLKQPKLRLAPILASLAFEHSENVVFSQNWWDAMPKKNRDILYWRMRGGSPMSPRTGSYLRDDGNTAISARISRIINHSS